MRRAREEVDDLSGLERIRVGQVEGLAIAALEMGDVVDRIGDEVDRDQVDLPAFDPDRRHPLREGCPESLDQLEEVVGAIHLVHLAGLGVADDDPRPVDPIGHLELLPDDQLGLVLGAEVGVAVEFLGLLEHVLAPDPLVEAGDGDRAGQVEAADLRTVGELDRVHRALDVRDPDRLVIGLHVVDRSKVEEVVDLPGELFDRGFVEAEHRLGEVADHRHDLARSVPPGGDQLLEPASRSFADQHVHGASTLEQLANQVTAYEAGAAGDEVIHRISSRNSSSIRPRLRGRYRPGPYRAGAKRGSGIQSGIFTSPPCPCPTLKSDG